jgi:hypothetical protein
MVAFYGRYHNVYPPATWAVQRSLYDVKTVAVTLFVAHCFGYLYGMM